MTDTNSDGKEGRISDVHGGDTAGGNQVDTLSVLSKHPQYKHLIDAQKKRHEEQVATGLNCPKCKGTQGFYYSYTERFTQYVDFEGNPIMCSEDSESWLSKRLRCIDCNTSITKYIKSLDLRDYNAL